MRIHTFALACALALALALSASAATTRIEAERLSTPAFDADATSGGWNQEIVTGASNDQTLWASLLGAEASFIFQGSGIDIVFEGRTDGALVDWMVDQGLPSEVSGQIDQSASSGLQSSATLVAAGTLDSTALHHVVITQASASPEVATLDAWDVHDAGTDRTRVGDRDPNITYVSDWAHNDTGGGADTEADDGDVSWTLLRDGSTQISMEFTGNSVGIVGANRTDGGVWNWDIDSGARTGQADFQSLPGGSNVHHRFTRLLANDLTSGSHTVTISPASPETIWVTVFDGFDIAGGHSNPQRRYEAEPMSIPPNDRDATNGGWTVDSAPVLASSSNGTLIWALPVGYPGSFIFQGSGVEMIFQGRGDGADVTWIVDEGLPSEITGSYSQSAYLGQQSTIVLVPPGTLDTSRLHHVKINRGAGWVCTIDAWDVYDDVAANSGWGSRERREDSYPLITYIGGWALNDPNPDSDDGDLAWTTEFDGSALIEFTFDGNSIALVGGNRWDGALCDWSIDSGARTGTLDLTSASGANYRTTYLLANDLAPGLHNITVTPTASSIWVFLFDGFDVIPELPAVTAVEDWTLYR